MPYTTGGMEGIIWGKMQTHKKEKKKMTFEANGGTVGKALGH